MPHTRPTTDMAREGLFNTLQHLMDLDGIKTLDLFGGTGTISYELASRGASALTLIEKDSKMAAFIESNLELLQIDEAEVIQMDVFRYLKKADGKFDFIFAGPPYALNTIDDIPNIIFENELLTEDGIFVLEHTPRNNYEQHKHFFKLKNYGTTLFSFFSH